ncbi:hypothetical protein KY285_027217 [Solanum tuberosum]|nr:hypothetical protein KY289_027427 [Solanum tuberosum]KAH0666011.1 hypothetical protein KY285_027217 [Solanum tuberosum]
MHEKLHQRDQLLYGIVEQQRGMCATQTGIQGTLELILDMFKNLERRPPRGQRVLFREVMGSCQYLVLMVGLLDHQWLPPPPPKWELPYFEGQDPKVWIQKCERYFHLHRVQDNMKVEGTALYLNGNAETWYNSLVLSRGAINWAELKEELCVRFRDEWMEDVVEEFNKLK